MTLFEDLAHMRSVSGVIRSGGFDDLPWFSMVRRLAELTGPDDPRLPLDLSLFIGGNVYPGDDTFLVLLPSEDPDPWVLVTAWEDGKNVEWTPALRISELITATSQL